SLDLILGYGGMVSFGHAAYLGIGAYAVGILGVYGIESGLIQWPVAILASALAALVIGAISLRTSGVSFIMITLAFAQMLYYLGISLEILGGIGTLFGPVVGAVVLLLLEDVLSALTAHWQIILGPFLVLVVLFAKRGLFGLVPEAGERRG